MNVAFSNIIIIKQKRKKKGQQPLEMVRLLRQTQAQPLPHLWLANGQHYRLGSSFSNESVKKVSHNNGLWSDT